MNTFDFTELLAVSLLLLIWFAPVLFFTVALFIIRRRPIVARTLLRAALTFDAMVVPFAVVFAIKALSNISRHANSQNGDTIVLASAVPLLVVLIASPFLLRGIRTRTCSVPPR